LDGGAVTDYMTVYPERGNESFVAGALLSLVANPNDVQVVSTPPRGQKISGSVGFRVPVDVFEAFQALMAAPLKGGEPVVESVTVAEVEKDEPVKRKPGRPKKVQEDQ
jgi:hypothetical protein